MKIIKIHVIPNAKKSEVIRDGNSFRVRLNAPAVEGKANSALIEVLADYFNVKKSKVKILRGEKSRRKVVEIV